MKEIKFVTSSFFIVFCFLFVDIAKAEYSFNLELKYPFSDQHYDTLGNVVEDSLARFCELKVIISRTEPFDQIEREGVTNDSGVVHFTFDHWHNGEEVKIEDIDRMDIEFPTREEAIPKGEEYEFVPLKIKDVDFRTDPYLIKLVLPLSVDIDIFEFGQGWFLNYAIAVIADPHFGEGAPKNSEGQEDFGTYRWFDHWDGSQTTYAIDNDELVIAKINDLVDKGWDIPFVVVLGDMTNSSERSEFEAARHFLSKLKIPYIPIFGNHDTWPYVGKSYNYAQQNYPTFGQLFYGAFEDYYDSLGTILSIPNWRTAPEFGQVQPPPPISDHPTYFFNLSFDYQNYRIIGLDFSTRQDAPGYYPGTRPSAHVYSNHPALKWLKQQVDNSESSLQKLFIFHHQPLISYHIPFWVEYCFNHDAIALVSDDGDLKNNTPLAIWLSGHLHNCPWVPGTHCDTTYYPTFFRDTVAIVPRFDAAKLGVLGIVKIYDYICTRIANHPEGDILPVTIDFDGIVKYGPDSIPTGYYWDFCDGSSPWYRYLQDPPPHIYHIYDDRIRSYKILFKTTIASGRPYYTAKGIRVGASPYTLKVKVFEDKVELSWNFDPPNLFDDFRIFRNGEYRPPPAVIGNSGYWEDLVVGRGNSYKYEVKARYNEYYSPAAETLVQIPWLDAPSGPGVEAISSSQVRFYWNDESKFETGYQIARKVEGEDWNLNYATVGANVEEFIDTVSILRPSETGHDGFVEV